MTHSHKTVGDVIENEIKGSDSKEEVYAKLNAALEKNHHIGKHAVDENGRTPYMRAVLHKDPNIHAAEWLEDSREHRAHGRKWHKTSPNLKTKDRHQFTALMHAVSFVDRGNKEVKQDIAVRRQFINRILAKRSHSRSELTRAVEQAVRSGNGYFYKNFYNLVDDIRLQAWHAINTCDHVLLENIYDAMRQRMHGERLLSDMIINTVIHILNSHQAGRINTEEANCLLDIAKKKYPDISRDIKEALETAEDFYFKFPELHNYANDWTYTSTEVFTRDLQLQQKLGYLLIWKEPNNIAPARRKAIADAFYHHVDLTQLLLLFFVSEDKEKSAKHWKNLFEYIIPSYETLDKINGLIDKLDLFRNSLTFNFKIANSRN